MVAYLFIYLNWKVTSLESGCIKEKTENSKTKQLISIRFGLVINSVVLAMVADLVYQVS